MKIIQIQIVNESFYVLCAKYSTLWISNVLLLVFVHYLYLKLKT